MIFSKRKDDKRPEGKGRKLVHMTSRNPLRHSRIASRNHRRCLSTVAARRTRLCLLLALALLFLAPTLYAQSGRNKQQTQTKSPSGGTTRPKRATPPTDSQTQSPQQTQAPIRLPRGTVVLDEAPPAPPAPKPTPAADTSAGEEIGVEDVVRITSNLVTVPASVVDAQGRAVSDLKLEDFELRVDGQPRPISDLNRAEVPVTLALLFDNSQSLTAAREFEKQAAIRFFRSVIRPIDRAAIYSVATDVTLVQPLTNNVNALVRTIEHFGKPEGATRLLDAIAEAATYLRPYPGRKVIIIVSDGEDTLSDLTDFDTVLRRVLTADCQVYAVQTKQIEYVMLTGERGNANIRALAAERRLQDLTAHTGGAVYTPLQTADLDAAFTQISADLAQQYILSYYPTDDRGDGRFRTISVRISTRSNMRVRARRGYYPRRPNERFSYTPPPQPSVSEPVISQSSLASRTDSLPRDLGQSNNLPALASNGASPERSGSFPVASRRRGPAETSDEPEAAPSLKTGGRVEEPVVKRNEPRNEAGARTVEPSPPRKPEPKPEPKAVPDSTPPTASNPKQSASNSSLDSTAQKPQESKPAESKPMSGGVLNGRALSLPQPQYPPNAKSMRASGIVTVEVLLDEQGRVVSAKAVDGHPLLRQSAVIAARQARFSPTMLSGQPVKVAGLITYKFTLSP
ncbi:MAG TPA: VWA domain-containing protein [Pyrinomonadaceae bacterium]